jgi:hypothetical protein
MKLLSRVLAVVLGLALLSAHAPITRADELPVDRIAPGGSSPTILTYADQTFRVSSTAATKIRFEMLSPSEIRIYLSVPEGGSPGRCSIYWVNFQKTIFLGTVPIDPPWQGDLDTEGGFVDR